MAKRFYISFVWTLAAFTLLIITTQPQDEWVLGLIGSAMLALLAGVIAAAIRTKKKIIFVPVSLLITMIIAAIIGTLAGT